MCPNEGNFRPIVAVKFFFSFFSAQEGEPHTLAFVRFVEVLMSPASLDF